MKITELRGFILTFSFTVEQRKILDLSCWKTAYNGAEPIRAKTVEKFTETFATCGFEANFFYPCYGLAESTLMVTGASRACLQSQFGNCERRSPTH